ncbi:MAG: glycosyltransferase family 4 protein [Alistipes sp.]|nr:glycosyltransferase family 4 protein [Alistipes sp.]
MERVLLNKVRYLVEKMGWEILIVTTDQHNRPPFYPFPAEVRMVDLGINYSEDNTKGTLAKVRGYLKRRTQHKKALTTLLMQERADIVVSLYPSESSFLPAIKDGSKKVLELHYCKFFRLQYGRKGLMSLIDRYRTRLDERLVRRFDRFVVLTEEDKGYWGNLPNIEVIPNAALFIAPRYSTQNEKRVIAVGRLDYQKGFDRLIEAWALVQQNPACRSWRLDIFGQGEWQEMLEEMIRERNLGQTAQINPPSKQIGEEYAASSILVMSSHYEGFPMVMIEAMACGVPVVSYDFKCGPRDIIREGDNGLIIPEGDISALAEGICRLIQEEELRRSMSMKAQEVTTTYSEEKVMRRWITLFNSMVR